MREGRLPERQGRERREEVGYIYLKDGLLWNMEEVVEFGGMKRYTGM